MLLLLFLLANSAGAEAPAQEQASLPRDFQEISLLMSVEEVKKELKKLHLRISEENIGSDPTLGLPYHDIIVDNPPREFRSVIYSFYEGKLDSIRVEYNMQNKSVDFEQVLLKLKEKYGEPDEALENSDPLFGIKTLDYRWRDAATQMQLGYSPPGKVPIFGQPHLGALAWNVFDRNLAQKSSEENERATRVFKDVNDQAKWTHPIK